VAMPSLSPLTLPVLAVGSPPWWGAPAGVIAGALIGLLAGLYTSRQRRIDEVAAAALARDQRMLDEQREAATGFLGAAHKFRGAVPNVDEMRSAHLVLNERLALVEIACSSALSGRGMSVAIRAQLTLFCAMHEDWEELKQQVVDLLSSERAFVDGARELAGYPPVDQEAKRAAEAEVDAWIQREFGESS
jgi:hypothetical protein